ncbi:MAG: IS4 family transposase [Candidatus Binatia bacterium]
MITENQAPSPREWAVEHFGGAELSNVKRVDRAITIAEAMAASPGASLPRMFAHPYDVKAAYTFFRLPEATPDNLQAGHRERVLCEMEKPGRYLMIDDTSEVLCTETGEIIGLGPVGASKDAQIGFHLHSTLVVRWPSKPDAAPPRRPTVEILGLADQQFHVRQPRSEEAKSHASLRRVLAADELESSLWEKASRRVGPAPEREDVIWIKMGDRGADIFDHLYECQKQNQRFVIRARQDRVLLTEDGKRAGKLFEIVRATASCGELELELRARPRQAARRAQLHVSFTPLILRAPQVAGQGPGAREPIVCMAVRIWEPHPPTGVDPLEWILLTDLEVANFGQACEVVQMYATRWLEEEFHKAIKTGMDAEGTQLKTAEAWFAVVAMKSVAALRLIEMRERMRLTPEAPAESSGLSELELEVLRARSGKPLATVAEVALAIGRLGGHLNRKRDGLPGWITLWRGWQVLQTLVEGVLLARKLRKFG